MDKPMKTVTIKIILTDNKINLDGDNLTELSENDVINIIKMVVDVAHILGILQEGDTTNENA